MKVRATAVLTVLGCLAACPLLCVGLSDAENVCADQLGFPTAPKWVCWDLTYFVDRSNCVNWCTHTHLHARAHARTHAHAHTHTHTHAHTHTHTHTVHSLHTSPTLHLIRCLGEMCAVEWSSTVMPVLILWKHGHSRATLGFWNQFIGGSVGPIARY